ncbi:MAG: hypothetical protein RIQ93_2660, partial [Verrucomicrobiota bacterium]
LTAGGDSHGKLFAAQTNRATFQQDGVNVQITIAP